MKESLLSDSPNLDFAENAGSLCGILAPGGGFQPQFTSKKVQCGFRWAFKKSQGTLCGTR
jgi:hypothetical protein